MTALGTASRGIGTPSATVVEAYAVCEEITRREARNFSYGIRLLPLEKRRALWQPPEPRYRRGVLAKFAALASTASLGAVTDYLRKLAAGASH